MDRLRYAVAMAAEWAKERPFRFALWIAVCDGVFAGIAYWATSELDEGRVLIVGGAVVVGIGVALLTMVIYALIRAGAWVLRSRVSALEETVEAMKSQLGELMGEKYGDPLQFLPIYHELRTDIREAIRLYERAKETGRLWARRHAPETGKWKKHRGAIATSPWARLDNLHGPLLEAFDHVERLNTDTALRFSSARRLRPTDDTDAALAALHAAEGGLTFSIERLEGLQGLPEDEDED